MNWLGRLFKLQYPLTSASTNFNVQSASTREKVDNPDALPDLVYCTLEVKGHRHQLNQFKKSLQGLDPSIQSMPSKEYSIFCFDKVIPIPKEVVKLNSIVVLEQFRVAYWASSLNACGVSFKETPHCLRYVFTTGTAAPLPVIKKLIMDNPRLKFEFKATCYSRGEIALIVGKNGLAKKWYGESYKNEKVGI
jgi:hypothetical protein